MIKRSDFDAVCRESLGLIAESGIHLSTADKQKITAADFGLNNIRQEGVQILTMFETERIAGKILVLLPHQTEPEHWHPPVANDPGKEEVIRSIWGDLRFYIPGEDNLSEGFLVAGKEKHYTMRNEIIMSPGDQLVLSPGTKHWFQAGPRGAVMYSFSSTVRDILDQFSDPDVIRETQIIEDQTLAK